ncbi:MAG: Protein of unknown function UPF0060 [uncultured Sphingomonadaceae bacterium]|uniref:Uncharacterized protein n=1 Tax=uncultured Sphingomonadaceae bacterium TaxID=169976 RepID=A0A6J4TCU0_9SPHN|nr:MAG: Protein of unknown function UPF0060 [uncultured Sphingomonadaceae bacterium]
MFASLLSLVVTATASRAFSAYGGVYVAASLGWLRWVRGIEPDRWDLAGATIYFVSAAVILLGPCAV